MHAGSFINVIFRTDGNSQIGLGHVIRSCALAQMLNKNGFYCQFVIKDPIQMLINEISNSGSEIIVISTKCTIQSELESIFKLIQNNKDIVVLDGYSFDENYQKTIKSRGVKLACIDDIHSVHFVADAIINHSGGIDPQLYSTETYTRLYLGPSYALLREPFLKQREIKISDRNILISMGGADPFNATMRILLDILDSNNFQHVHVVLGGAYNYESQLIEAINLKDAKEIVTIHKLLNAVQMAELMAECPVAITPPSTVAFEYLTVGGILYLCQIAENQRDVKKYFLDEELAFDFDMFPITDERLIQKVSQKSKKVFDRGSAKRLVEVFKSI